MELFDVGRYRLAERHRSDDRTAGDVQETRSGERAGQGKAGVVVRAAGMAGDDLG